MYNTVQERDETSSQCAEISANAAQISKIIWSEQTWVLVLGDLYRESYLHHGTEHSHVSVATNVQI
ncbi:unnamed protein product [Ranitomeya imitator]|uniref:Uncharacterized protein n=1 Tax=Ranitomeya imitator TaxID=111125 RepID=A0ABN9MQ53_9NEOB|nr:unnamed protein product [Ranitomeya imitator]